METSTSLYSFEPKLDTCFLSSASLTAFRVASLWLPLTFLIAESLANANVAYLEQASKNSCLTNSLTKTRSGAYGDVPPKLNLAFVIALAARSTSAVRSTIATVRVDDAERSWFVRVVVLVLLVWSTSVALSSMDESLICFVKANVLKSRAVGRTLRRIASTWRRVSSS